MVRYLYIGIQELRRLLRKGRCEVTVIEKIISHIKEDSNTVICPSEIGLDSENIDCMETKCIDCWKQALDKDYP